MVGIICHEHVGPIRNWTVDEENFAYLMSNIVAMAIESKSEKNIDFML
jgi:GAF domain-containing protein